MPMPMPMTMPMPTRMRMWMPTWMRMPMPMPMPMLMSMPMQMPMVGPAGMHVLAHRLLQPPLVLVLEHARHVVEGSRPDVQSLLVLAQPAEAS